MLHFITIFITFFCTSWNKTAKIISESSDDKEFTDLLNTSPKWAMISAIVLPSFFQAGLFSIGYMYLLNSAIDLI